MVPQWCPSMVPSPSKRFEPCEEDVIVKRFAFVKRFTFGNRQEPLKERFFGERFIVVFAHSPPFDGYSFRLSVGVGVRPCDMLLTAEAFALPFNPCGTVQKR